MIIDFHTHCYPDTVAPKAIANLFNFGVLTHTDGTVQGLKDSMQTAKVDLSVFLPIATRPNQFNKLNDFAKSIECEQIISFGSVYPFDENWKEIIDYVAKIGLKGIKLHPDFQEFYFSEKRIEDIIGYALDKNLLVTVHVGVDPYCLELVYSVPQMVSKLVDKFKSRNFILAHLGGHLYWNEVLDYIAGKTCTIDTALTIGAINQKMLIKILEKHGYDNVVFGSDSPCGSQRISVKTFKTLNISPENLDKIFYKNALKLLKL